MFGPSHLASLKFVNVVRIPQEALSGVSILPINVNIDIGICPSSQHVTGEDAHFVGVDCQTKENDELLTCLEIGAYLGQEAVLNQTAQITPPARE